MKFSELLRRALGLDDDEKYDLIFRLLREIRPTHRLFRVLEDYRVLRGAGSCEPHSEEDAWEAVRTLHLGHDPDGKSERGKKNERN